MIGGVQAHETPRSSGILFDETTPSATTGPLPTRTANPLTPQPRDVKYKAPPCVPPKGHGRKVLKSRYGVTDLMLCRRKHAEAVSKACGAGGEHRRGGVVVDGVFFLGQLAKVGHG